MALISLRTLFATTNSNDKDLLLNHLANFCHHVCNKFIGTVVAGFLATAIFSIEVHSQQAPSNGSLQLLRWNPSTRHQVLVLPKLKSESPQAAIEAYLSSTESDPYLKNLTIGNALLSNSYKINESDWSILDASQTKSVLLVANRLSDHQMGDSRVQDFVQMIERSKSSYMLLPVGASFRLNESERMEFHNLLGQNSQQTTIFMGGSDLDPAHYDEMSTHSKNINSLRDSLEIALAKDLYLSGKGRLVGFCRGAQLIAVALGYKLIQDIAFVAQSTLKHGSGLPGGPGVRHQAIIEKTTGMWLAKLAGLFVDGSLKTPRVLLNSFHHQAIADKLDGPLEVAARAPDGTIEWLESRDGRVLLRQDHPEKPLISRPAFRFFINLLQPFLNPSGIRCAALLGP